MDEWRDQHSHGVLLNQTLQVYLRGVEGGGGVPSTDPGLIPVFGLRQQIVVNFKHC